MTNYSWPVNARSVVFVSVNFDAESFDLKETCWTAQTNGFAAEARYSCYFFCSSG